jgi:NAD(P)-dependent dehydrogenase (short-subunit alcohol dehydrogenase family)
VNLEGKIAIVTGAGYGIGKGIALRLAKDGADVVVNYGHSERDADETAAEIVALGRRAPVVQADVTKWSQVEGLVAACVDEFGRLDIMVNNAGVAKAATLLQLDENLWDYVVDINLKGAYLCSRAAALQMVVQGQGGRIIQIGSVNSTRSVPGRAHYAASKAGLVAMNRVIACELAEYGITCNVVAPGATRSRMSDPDMQDKQKSARILGAIPMHRIGQPEDVAAVVAFLASGEAAYITGVNVDVDGGLLTAPLFV